MQASLLQSVFVPYRGRNLDFQRTVAFLLSVVLDLEDAIQACSACGKKRRRSWLCLG